MHYIVTYPNEPGSRFDLDYYLKTHLPMSERLLKDYGFTGWEVEKGLAGPRGESPAFHCTTRLYFNDTERMRAGFMAHGEQLRTDVRNYTDVEAIFTLAEEAGKQNLG